MKNLVVRSEKNMKWIWSEPNISGANRLVAETEIDYFIFWFMLIAGLIVIGGILIHAYINREKPCKKE